MKTGSNSAFIVTFHESNLLMPWVDIFCEVMSLEIGWVWDEKFGWFIQIHKAESDLIWIVYKMCKISTY